MKKFTQIPPAILNKECALRGLRMAEDVGIGILNMYDKKGNLCCALGWIIKGCGIEDPDNSDNYILVKDILGPNFSAIYKENDNYNAWANTLTVRKRRLSHMIRFVEACPEMEETA